MAPEVTDAEIANVIRELQRMESRCVHDDADENSYQRSIRVIQCLHQSRIAADELLAACKAAREYIGNPWGSNREVVYKLETVISKAEGKP